MHEAGADVLHDQDRDGKRFWEPASIVCKTGGPPVEAPIATSRTAAPRRAGAAIGGIGRAGAGLARMRDQRRMTRTSAMAFTVSINFRAQLAWSEMAGAAGLFHGGDGAGLHRAKALATSSAIEAGAHDDDRHAGASP